MITTSQPQAYVHKVTGDVKMMTPGQAVFMPDYNPVTFFNGKDGKPVMRVRLEHATVDISEDGRQEAVKNVDSKSK